MFTYFTMKRNEIKVKAMLYEIVVTIMDQCQLVKY